MVRTQIGLEFVRGRGLLVAAVQSREERERRLSRKNVISRVVALAVLALAAPLYVTAQPATNKNVLERQATMKGLGGDMRQATRFASGQDPYDAAKVKALMAAVSASAAKTKGLFPADSAADPKTTALPRIWKEKAAFNKRLDELSALAKAAGAATTPAAYKAQLQTLGGTCKGCHDLYRKSAS